jgi:formylglycine-generating enzyme required for sulfatase activity
MVPVFLPLRNLVDLEQGIDTFLEHELASPHLHLPKDIGRILLERGNLLILLDGLDEVSNQEHRAKVARWIESAAVAYPNCRFVVTCSYAGYRDKAQLSAEFLELHLRPLNDEEVHKFVHNWFRIVETGIEGDSDRVRDSAANAADKLLEQLRQPEFRARRVYELTHNPLLLTTICLVHRDRGRLPQRRTELYNEATNVLLERWQGAKDLTVSMPAEKSRQVLQPVAYWMHGEEGRTQASTTDLAPIIEGALAATKISNLSAAEFLAKIRDESGLLTGWSSDSFGFMHLGFQEYLAAYQISRKAVGDPTVLQELARRFGESWWREVTLLVLGLDLPHFDAFMREVTEQPAFAERSSLVEECIDDALQVSFTPFVDLISANPGDSEPFWRRQLTALRIVQQHAPDELAPLEARLREHPYKPIAALFEPVEAEIKTIVAARGGYEMVWIPGGTFEMGSPTGEQDRYEDEGPQHEVRVPAFYLGLCPVTNEEYGRYLAENSGVEPPEYWSDRSYNQPKQPVVGVSWNEAKAYCEWAGLQLPSEAQWEYACRAGTKTRYWSGDSDEDLANVGWYFGNSGNQLQPVRGKPHNAFGLFDMHGNVHEWCEDTWHDNYKRAPTDGSAWVSRDEASRVLRGGAFGVRAQFARSAIRNDYHPGVRNFVIGFRPARVIPE